MHRNHRLAPVPPVPREANRQVSLAGKSSRAGRTPQPPRRATPWSTLPACPPRPGTRRSKRFRKTRKRSERREQQGFPSRHSSLQLILWPKKVLPQPPSSTSSFLRKSLSFTSTAPAAASTFNPGPYSPRRIHFHLPAYLDVPDPRPAAWPALCSGSNGQRATEAIVCPPARLATRNCKAGMGHPSVSNSFGSGLVPTRR